jgi:hypothetical protein
MVIGALTGPSANESPMGTLYLLSAAAIESGTSKIIANTIKKNLFNIFIIFEIIFIKSPLTPAYRQAGLFTYNVPL